MEEGPAVAGKASPLDLLASERLDRPYGTKGLASTPVESDGLVRDPLEHGITLRLLPVGQQAYDWHHHDGDGEHLGADTQKKRHHHNTVDDDLDQEHTYEAE